MLSATERWVFFYDLLLKQKPDDAPPIPIKEIMEMLQARQLAGDSVKLINNETAAIRIKQLKVDKKNRIVFLLLQYCDKAIADPVFGNLETGELRVEPKLDGEGIAVSAHMAISLDSKQPRSNNYLSLFEEVPGISKSRIEPFLTSELRKGCQFEFKDANEQIRSCRPVPEMFGHPSQSLKEDLERGALQQIELVNLKFTEKDFDEAGYTQEVNRKIFLKTKRQYDGGEALDVIERIKELAKSKGYDEMRVKYKRYEGKHRTVSIDTRRDDALEKLYTRCEMVRFKAPLNQCLADFDQHMVSYMGKIICNSR